MSDPNDDDKDIIFTLKDKPNRSTDEHEARIFDKSHSDRGTY